MKTALASLTGVLYNINVQKTKELYTFEFGSGTKVYWTTAEAPVTSGSVTWTPFVIQRGQSRSAIGMEVSTIDLVLYPGSTTLDGVMMPLAATQGAFDSAQVKVERSYTNASGTIYTTLFEGTTVDVQPASAYVKLTVKSGLAKLDLPFPPRVLQAQCTWMLYDTNCGVASASFSTTNTVAANSTTMVVKTTGLTTDQYKSGLLTFTSGPLSGLKRTVASNTTTSVVVFPSLPSLPSVGDSFRLTRACDKTKSTCKNVFNNLARFGGYPDVPAPEK